MPELMPTPQRVALAPLHLTAPEGAEIIPIEPETNIPLIVIASEDLPEPGLQGEGANWHHPLYPRKRKAFKSLSGTALRHGRVEWLNMQDHQDYHELFDDYIINTWEFPKTTEQRFGMTVLLGAGYVPPVAIALRDGGASYVKLEEQERQSYWERGVLRVESESAMYKFMHKFVSGQDIQGIADKRDLEIFFFSGDGAQRVEAGDRLLTAAALAATDSIRATYLEACKKRLVMPRMPSEPQELITQNPIALGTEKRRRKARSALRINLARKLGVEGKLAV
jgi:hypothetical protein